MKVSRANVEVMDRQDILNLYVVASLPLPEGALPARATNLRVTNSELPF